MAEQGFNCGPQRGLGDHDADLFMAVRGISVLVCIVPQVFEQEDRHYGLAAAGHALHDDRMPAVVLKAVEYGVYSRALVVGEFFVGGIFEKV